MPAGRVAPARGGSSGWTGALLLLCLASLAGFAGCQHWLLDLLSHFRPHYALALAAALAVGVARGAPRWVVWACALCLLAQAGVLLPSWLPPARHGASGLPALRVLLANVHTGNRRFGAVADLLRGEAPDLVVLQETDLAWIDGLGDVRASYPHRVEEPRADNFGIALWSRLPLAEAGIEYWGDAGVPSVVARVVWRGTAVRLAATHPLPPVGQRRSRLRDQQLAALARWCAEQDGPILVVGDLNCSPWSPRFRDLLRRGRLHDSAAGRGFAPTWPSPLGWLGIPIDHCLYRAGLRVVDRRLGPDVGSDHRPLLVDLTAADGR